MSNPAALRMGQAVTMARLGVGLSRRELANAIPGMTEARLTSIERGMQLLKPRELGAIKRAVDSARMEAAS